MSRYRTKNRKNRTLKLCRHKSNAAKERSLSTDGQISYTMKKISVLTNKSLIRIFSTVRENRTLKPCRHKGNAAKERCSSSTDGQVFYTTTLLSTSDQDLTPTLKINAKTSKARDMAKFLSVVF